MDRRDKRMLDLDWVEMLDVTLDLVPEFNGSWNKNQEISLYVCLDMWEVWGFLLLWSWGEGKAVSLLSSEAPGSQHEPENSQYNSFSRGRVRRFSLFIFTTLRIMLEMFR